MLDSKTIESDSKKVLIVLIVIWFSRYYINFIQSTMKEVVLVLLSVFMLVSTQEYLPKEPGYLPINDLYARDIARSGWDTFWKVDQS